MSGKAVDLLTRKASGSGRSGGGPPPAPGGSNPVKLAGEESKDKLYEPKHSKKLVRVLTVVAYMFSVSLAAIMLSVYYVFLWNPPDPPYAQRQVADEPPLCGGLSLQYQHQLLFRQQMLQQQQQAAQPAAGDSSFQALHQVKKTATNSTGNYNLTTSASSTSVPHTNINQTTFEPLAT